MGRAARGGGGAGAVPAVKPEVASNWSCALIVCGKCSKQVGRVFGDDGDVMLAKALRAELGVGKGRKAAAGIVEAKCLGLCPKRAVVVMDGARPDHWLLVRPGTPAADVLARLGDGDSSPSVRHPGLVPGSTSP